MECHITSRSETVTLKNIQSLQLPTRQGVVTIRKGHAEYFTQVHNGILEYIDSSNIQKEIPVASGVCHVQKDRVVIVV